MLPMYPLYPMTATAGAVDEDMMVKEVGLEVGRIQSGVVRGQEAAEYSRRGSLSGPMKGDRDLWSVQVQSEIGR